MEARIKSNLATKRNLETSLSKTIQVGRYADYEQDIFFSGLNLDLRFSDLLSNGVRQRCRGCKVPRAWTILI